MLAIFMVLLTASSLSANPATEQWSKKSVITLTDLSEVPGMVIEPGTYVLKADETAGNERTTLLLLNQDESQVLTSFIAIPDHRQRPDLDTVITFFDGVSSDPKPIQTWFYMGEMNGYEFVYPKPRAKEISKFAEDHVMGSESKDAAIFAITPNGTEVAVYDARGKSGKASITGQAARAKPGRRPRPKQPR